MSLCFSLKVIFQTQNYRSAPKWWTAYPETSVALGFRKGLSYFINTLLSVSPASLHVSFLTWEQGLCINASSSPTWFPVRGCTCYRSLREGQQQKLFPSLCFISLDLEGSLSSLSFLEGKDPWAFYKIDFHIAWGFHELYFSLVFWKMHLTFSLVSWLSATGSLCSQMTALPSAPGGTLLPLPDLPRASFSMLSQLIEEKMLIRIIYVTMNRAKS